MSQPFFDSESLARIREDALTLTTESRACQTRIEALAAAVGRDLRAARAELVHALDVTSSPIEDVRNVLRHHLQRTIASARAARRLVAAARGECLAAARLLSYVTDERRREQPASTARDVLVVDDHDDTRELVRIVLDNAGFVVRTAANGLEALIVAHQTRPAVIVMDLAMPILDGLEATRLIKADEATRHARVIAYTGNPITTTNASHELFAVLQKPALPDVVLQTVRRAAGL
jgi:CheY-like chemotaxis protein